MNFDMQALEDAIVAAYCTATNENANNFSWYELEEILCGKHNRLSVDGFGELSQEFFDTGGEGHGENVYMVFRLVNAQGTHFFKKEGYYASHYGTDWDGPFSQVTPVERMVTFYE
jgi:hypothetical protein